MARDVEIERKLMQWASWKEGRGGSLGYKSAGFELRTAGGYREAAIPINDIEAGVTDQAVLRLPSAHRAAVEAYYLRGGSVAQAAARLCIGERMLQVRIGQAHDMLRRWFADRERAADAQRERVEALIQAARPG